MGVRSSGLVTDRVFDDLLRRVLTGDVPPGDRLPTQRQLALEQGVTLSSLREALKRLEQLGLLDIRHGDATYVRDWRRHGTLDVLRYLLVSGTGVEPDTLRDLLEARSATLREIAGMAAARATADDDHALTRLAHEVAVATSRREATHADFAFFAALAQATHNIVYTLLLNAVGETYLPHAELLPVAADQSLAPRYAQLAAAVGAGDVAGARSAAWTLAEEQRRRVLEALT